MRATVIHAPRDIRVETVPDPVLSTGADAIVRVVACCVCGGIIFAMSAKVGAAALNGCCVTGAGGVYGTLCGAVFGIADATEAIVAGAGNPAAADGAPTGF